MPYCVRPLQQEGRLGDDIMQESQWSPWGWGAPTGAQHLQRVSTSSGRSGPSAGAGAAAGAATQRSGATSGSGTTAEGLADDLAAELAATPSGGKSAADPIGVLVQLTGLRGRHKLTFTPIKLSALMLLRMFSAVRRGPAGEGGLALVMVGSHGGLVHD